jgi:hypothetical protein
VGAVSNVDTPCNGVTTTMDRTTLDVRPPVTVMGTMGMRLTVDETLMLQAVFSSAERVDWAVYEQLKLRVLAWPSRVTPEREWWEK